jgi:DNA-3-methyladenine glycosylase II
VTSLAQITGARTMMIDHPGWLHDTTGRIRRAVTTGHTTWVLAHDPFRGTLTHHAITGTRTAPIVDLYDPATLPGPIQTAVSEPSGAVHRLRNPDLWDALITPVAGHRRSLADAIHTYRRFCHLHGETLPTPHGPVLLPPRPEIAATLPDHAYRRVSLRPTTMRGLAHTLIDLGEHWRHLPPADLTHALRAVPGIGPWTASTAVADVTGDFSVFELSTATLSHGTELPWHDLTPDQHSTAVALSLDRRARNSRRVRTAFKADRSPATEERAGDRG